MYVGVTNDLERRILEHRDGLVKGFTKRYNVKKLVYYEDCFSSLAAVNRERQIKGWRREKKNKLVETLNPGWQDLFVDYEIPHIRSG